MYESWEQKSEDDCRCQSVKNVLAGDCHEVVITCDVACGLVSPSWGEGECHSRWPESSLSVWRGTHSINDDWLELSSGECQRWESWGDGKHEQHSAQNTNHTAVESDYHFTCLTTMKVWAPCWQISPCHDSWDPGKLHISLSLNISHPCNRFMIATWCASLTSRL